MAFSLTTVAEVIMLLLVIASRTGGIMESEVCEGLTSYNLQLNTFWSQETFYRQYPTYRPNAQWSRLIGRTHNGRYSIWSEGKVATEALREFTEKGSSSVFDIEPQGSKGIFDAFVSPNVTTGVGVSSTKFLAHVNYSKLSFVVRMIPSPDWFIGVDSLDLCTDGEWIPNKTLDLRPLDSGTDRGLSFTSPNWPENPHQAIYALTPTFPKHPASSFYYPEWKSGLPPIAQLRLTRIDSLWLDEPDTVGPQNSTHENLSAISDSPASHAFRESNIEVYEEISSNVDKFTPAGNKAVVALGKSIVETEYQHSSHNTSDSTRSLARSVVRKKYIQVGSRYSRNGRNARIASSKMAFAETGGVNSDCVVTDWSDWSSCSKTCDFGVRTRTRIVIQRRLNGGKPCPFLREEQLCGGVRSCSNPHNSRPTGPAAAASVETPALASTDR